MYIDDTQEKAIIIKTRKILEGVKYLGKSRINGYNMYKINSSESLLKLGLAPDEFELISLRNMSTEISDYYKI